MLKKQKKQSLLKIIFFVIFLAVLITVGFEYRTVMARYWYFIVAVVERQGAYERALALKHETLGVYCVMINLESAEECYLFEGRGILFDRVRTVVSDVIVRVEEQAAEQPALGASFVSSVDWKYIRSILEAVRDERLAASRIALDRTHKELTVYVAPQDIPFYFSYAFSPESHIEALPEFFKKVQLQELQYADMRIENKIFYR